MRGWLAFIVVSIPAFAHAQRAVAPVSGAAVRSQPLAPLAAPSLSLTDGFLSPGALPALQTVLPTVAELGLPENAAGLEAPLAAAEPALREPAPISAAPAARVQPARKPSFAARIREAVSSWSGRSAAKTDFSAKLDAGFDGRDPLSRYLREEWEMPVAAEPAARYRAALEAPSYSRQEEHDRELVSAAADFAESAGIAVERSRFDIGGKEFDGFRVVANKESRLNKLARRVQEGLAATMDFVPGRTAGASAMFNTEEGRLYLPAFGDMDSYAAILHEIRHAFYTELVRRGQTRLFHFALLGAGRHKVAPNAWGYSTYLSLEELTTYPKTLRHLVTLARKQKTPEARRKAISTLETRVLQYHEILQSARYNMDFAERRRQSGHVEAHRLDPESLRTRQLGAPPEGHQYAVRLPHAYAYFPVEKERAPTLWEKWFGRKDAQALAVFDLKVSLIQELISENRPILNELIALLEAGGDNLASMQALTTRLVANTKDKDDAFVARYRALRAKS